MRVSTTNRCCYLRQREAKLSEFHLSLCSRDMLDSTMAHCASYFHKQWTIIDVNCVLHIGLSDVECQRIDVFIRLAIVNIRGNNEGINEITQIKFFNAVICYLTAFIADCHNLDLKMPF